MTELSPLITSHRSPRAIRNATFSHRMRGLDEQEVREFLEEIANQMEVADAERAKLRAEVERLRAEREERSQADGPGDINAHAVALFSQAQQVADRLVAEAVQHARDLMANARAQQREILQRAHEAAEAAARQSSVSGGTDGEPSGYQRPIPEIEYVRTFARVAQVQLKSVLDALAEEVEKLGELPRMPADQQPPPSRQIAQVSDVSWSVSVGASATTAAATSPFDLR